MKIIFSNLASALLLTYLSVQVFTLFPQNSPFIVYVTVFLGLVINGLFIHFQSKSGSDSPKHEGRRRPQQRRNSPRAQSNSRTTKSRARPKQQEKSNQMSTVDDANRLEGEIKWYNRRKNYGFILEDSGEEIFFHQQEVEEGSRQNAPIDKGQRVNFVKTETEKGPQAQRVKIIS